MKEPIEVKADFKVIDESEDWIVVDKAAPLIVHPAKYPNEPSLLGGLQMLLSCELALGGHLSIINRLDRETSGLVLVAKNPHMAREMNLEMQAREVEKGYMALVFGWPAWNEVVCKEPLLRAGDVEESRIWLKQKVHEQGKEAQTSFQVLWKGGFEGKKVALIEAKPHTGRMHQIRVHASYLGHPLLGDKLYGHCDQHYLDHIDQGFTREMASALLMRRQALHACSLTLRSMSLTWDSPMPLDFQKIINCSEAAD